MNFKIKNITPSLNGKWKVELEAMLTTSELKELMDVAGGSNEVGVKP